MRWVGHVAPMGEEEQCIRCFVGEIGGKELLGRPRNMWEDNCGSSESGMEHGLD